MPGAKSYRNILARTGASWEKLAAFNRVCRPGIFAVLKKCFVRASIFLEGGY